MKQEVAEGEGVDQSAMSVSCEGAEYTEVPRDLPSTVTTLDLSGNTLETLEPLSRLQHVVNLRLRANRIDRIRDVTSPLTGMMGLKERSQVK